MSTENSEKAQVDPFANVVEFYDNWTKAWAKSMSEMVASPRMAETMAQQTEGSLDFWSVVNKQVSEAMEQYLQRMSLPTHGEIMSLAQQLTAVEMRLDDMEAKLDEVLDQLKKKADQ